MTQACQIIFTMIYQALSTQAQLFCLYVSFWWRSIHQAKHCQGEALSERTLNCVPLDSLCSTHAITSKICSPLMQEEDQGMLQ